jgi:hypothetical protein
MQLRSFVGFGFHPFFWEQHPRNPILVMEYGAVTLSDTRQDLLAVSSVMGVMDESRPTSSVMREEVSTIDPVVSLKRPRASTRAEDPMKADQKERYRRAQEATRGVTL